jgi:DtxR family manganese transport transcriptional regulator
LERPLVGCFDYTTTIPFNAKHLFFRNLKQPSLHARLSAQFPVSCSGIQMAPQRKSGKLNTGSKRQAEYLSQTRREHANEIAEDYVEAIADLVTEVGEARVVDLAKRLGVTHVTVNRTVARLQNAGLVTSEPYRAIFLTDKGRTLATACKSRHETVVAFLRSLGISERIAEMDAEGIEHHVSPETLSAFKRHTSSH